MHEANDHRSEGVCSSKHLVLLLLFPAVYESQYIILCLFKIIISLVNNMVCVQLVVVCVQLVVVCVQLLVVCVRFSTGVHVPMSQMCVFVMAVVLTVGYVTFHLAHFFVVFGEECELINLFHGWL